MPQNNALIRQPTAPPQLDQISAIDRYYQNSQPSSEIRSTSQAGWNSNFFPQETQYFSNIHQQEIASTGESSTSHSYPGTGNSRLQNTHTVHTPVEPNINISNLRTESNRHHNAHMVYTPVETSTNHSNAGTENNRLQNTHSVHTPVELNINLSHQRTDSNRLQNTHAVLTLTTQRPDIETQVLDIFCNCPKSNCIQGKCACFKAKRACTVNCHRKRIGQCEATEEYYNRRT